MFVADPITMESASWIISASDFSSRSILVSIFLIVLMVLVEVDGDALVEVAEGAEVFGEGAACEELSEGCCGAELVVVAVCNNGVSLAGWVELVAFAKFAALCHQLVHLRFGEECRCHFLVGLPYGRKMPLPSVHCKHYFLHCTLFFLR